MTILKLKRNKLGGTVAPLPREPKFLWPGEGGWGQCVHGKHIEDYKNGDNRIAHFERMLSLGVTLWHVAYQGKWLPDTMELERHDKLYASKHQAEQAIELWLHPAPKDYSKQKHWHERNRLKMRAWRRDYMRRYRELQNGIVDRETKPVPSNTITIPPVVDNELKLCHERPRDKVVCPPERWGQCRGCPEKPQPYTCDWCGSFTSRSAEQYIGHIEKGCPMLHHKPLRKNKYGGTVCPTIKGGR